MTSLTENHLPGAPVTRPITSVGPIAWARTNLFSSWGNTVVTLICIAVVLKLVWGVLVWGVFNAVWNTTAQECQMRTGVIGACWSIIGEKYRFILFGRYPYQEQWRPLGFVIIFLLLCGTSAYKPLASRLRMGGLLGLWAGGLVVSIWLMLGGILGLSYVQIDNWGGLPLTLMLAVAGIGLAFPPAVLLALGRRSSLPVIRYLCVGYIEIVRGLPLVTILITFSLVLPLFLPDGVTVEKVMRAQLAFMMFSAALVAEIIRAGLQSIPKGQWEAADALGLSYWRKIWLIILPQALKLVIPPLVNTFISMFKDTSLAFVIGLYELLGAAKTAVADPVWRQYYVEAYIFAGAFYFLFCFGMSKFSQKMERDLQRGHRR